MVVRIDALTDPSAVRGAIAEFDRLERDEFLSRYGYETARVHFVEVDGRYYDSTAIAGVAYGRQFPDQPTPSGADFSGGERKVAEVLRRLGFRVVEKVRPATQVSRDAVEAVMDEWDSIERDEFMRLHQVKPALKFLIEREGRRYDAIAVVTVAYRREHPDEPPLRTGDFSGDVTSIREPLELLGLAIVDGRGEGKHAEEQSDEELERRDPLLRIVQDEPGGGATGSRRFWWVNQNQTHREEIAGGFMWSPKRNANGARNQFYDNMRDVEPGDTVFSFYDTQIQCIGVATARAESTPKPDFGPGGQSNNWSQEGWLVGVEYTRLDTPFRPKDAIDLIRPLLPSKYSPLRDNGDGLQSVYLAELSADLANVLLDLADATVPSVPPATDPEPPAADKAEEEEQLANLQGRTDIGDVERTQLVKARRGQGIFRTNVRMNEPQCRVTGITDVAHLRASHIKPWKDSTDTEKINGCNGLLLAPHIDHLFDRGWISFTDDGDLMVAKDLSSGVLHAWRISEGLNVGSFSATQAVFLEFHRTHVFRDGAL